MKKKINYLKNLSINEWLKEKMIIEIIIIIVRKMNLIKQVKLTTPPH